MKKKSTLFPHFLRFFKMQAILVLLLAMGFAFGQTQTVTINTTGAGSWTVPPNVTSITVEAWGGGGAGGGTGTNNARGGGGGAGGTYVSSTLAVLPGQNIPYSVGSGATGAATAGPAGTASWFRSNTELNAQGGAGGAAPSNSNVNGGIGSNSTSVGTTIIVGANGGNGSTTVAGNGGRGGNNGGVGGNSGGTGGAGSPGQIPGGGGGGAFVNSNTNRAGGSGGNGQIKITYTGYCTPPANTTGCDGDNISSVLLGTLNDTGLTCSPEYANRENVQNAIPDLVQNTTISMSVGVGNGGTEYVGVWIDYNQNGIFENTEYTALGSGNNIVVTGTITIPMDALTGNTYMRVRSRFNAAPGGTNACVAFTYGTTRDYKVNIIPIPPATLDYTEDFENNPHYWTLINGSQANKWFVSNFVNNGGSRSLYISSNSTGTTNSYANTASVVHAYRDVAIPMGVPLVGIYYDWRANGDTSGNDYFRVWLVPQSYQPIAGSIITAAGGRILLNAKQNRNNNWSSQYNDNVDVSSFMGQNMRLIFEWINDANTATQNAAAIDNVEVKRPCAGTPNGGTAAIAPGTGAPSSNFNVSVSGSTVAAGISYQWQVSNDGTTGWADIAGATSAGTTTLTAVPLASTTRYYRRKMTCANGGGVGYSNVVSFTTTAATYCNGTTQTPNALYINSVAIVGTMADPPVNSAGGTGAGANGYSNFTNLTQIAQQAQGEGVNVLASVTGNTLFRGRWKAWIDWNGNGTFDNSELVYTTGGIVSATANFGFAIPVNQEPGNYRMRIRVNNGRTFGTENYGYDFEPCDNFTGVNNGNYGETEDYLIQVVANCVAKIATVTHANECNVTGGKQVTLSATSTIPVMEFRWYDAAANGNLVATTAPDGSGMATTYLTNALSTTTTYYVTAYNGTCESTFRTPVIAEIKPTPEISFTPSTLEICGETNVIAVSAVGGNQIKHLFAKQTFENGDLGVFSNQDITNITGSNNALVRWRNRSSVYIPGLPSYLTWYPAISSGFGSNSFAMSTSDVNPSGTVDKALLSPSTLDSRGLVNLTLKFKMFFSRYQANGSFPGSEYVSVEISTNNGTNWTQIDQINNDVGQGTAFEEKIYNLNTYIGVENLRIRIRYHAEGWYDGVAVDDVELYGEEPLQPSFTWSSSNPIGVYTDAAGTIDYTGGPISTVYFKPTEDQMESYANWNATATASLANSCNAVGTISIVNNTKTWKHTGTNWFTNNWLPSGNGASTADKCVVIKTPVIINANADALARNIKIETANGATGKLTINGNGSLTVTDGINNTGAPTDFIVKSNANLVQINPDPTINTTPIAVRRLHSLTPAAANGTRKEYNFLSSPVANQNMKTIYGDNAANVSFVTKLNEATNMFVNATVADYAEKGRGFAVKEPKVYTPAAGLTASEAEYKNIPNNGDITVNLNWTAPGRGYNVVGNPYPSNVDIIDLYANSTQTLIDPTFRFWDNKVNDIYVQMGGAYQGYSYAIFNALTDTDGFGVAAPGKGGSDEEGNPYPAGDKIPNRVIKVSQAFMVRALGAGAQLKFTNQQRRTTNTGTEFFGKESTKNRYRLQLVKSDGFTVQNGIAYFAAGNNDFGKEDSRIPNSSASDALFSYAGDAKVVINGRSSFTTDDVIPLGLRHFATGTYKIEAVDLEGVFANGQKIYLKDKEMNTITDLTEGDYSFSTEAGEFTNRFEIVYQPTVVLGSGETAMAGTVIYRDGEDFVVRSSDRTVERVEVYDASGRLLLTRSGNSRELRFSASTLSDGVYVVKSLMKGGAVFTQKIRK